MSILKVGCLQLKLNKTNNIEHIIQSIDKAYKDCPKLDLIVLSELAVGGAGAKDSEHTLDKYVNLFSKIAKDKSIWLIPGSFYEKVNDENIQILKNVTAHANIQKDIEMLNIIRDIMKPFIMENM